MRYVILLSVVETEAARTLFEALRHAGVCVVVVPPEGACGEEAERARAGWGEEPLAVLFDIATGAALADLRERAERAAKVWPAVPLVACRRDSSAAGAGRSAQALNEATLKRLGFHAVAAGPAQISALLREVEERGTEDGRRDEDQQPEVTPASLLLPERLCVGRLRAAFEVVASLHFASDLRGAAQAALAGLAALVPADRWTIYVLPESAAFADPPFEPLAVRGLTPSERAIPEEDWRRALAGDALALAGCESRAAREAAGAA
ncbi:MAG TPA: hypothetical protein VF508_13265, partial [Pyrinomonadaceae bacterium]